METKIYDFLVSYCKGKDNLIKNKNLRKIFSINSDRALREVIQNIRQSKEYPLVIGSISGKQGGFYICTTEDEIEEAINNIKHRANQMLRMCHILDWKKGKLNG